MMEKTNKKTPNILILISAFLFIFTSAFTLVPDLEIFDFEHEVITSQADVGCWTCDFGESGPPSSVCAEASYCGMSGGCLDGNPCFRWGNLCGVCDEEVEPL